MHIRKIGLISRTYRHAERYHQILVILFKYGFGDIIATLHIGRYIDVVLPKKIKRQQEIVKECTPSERARMAMEELGPTFIKMGQFLSTRPDLIPMEFLTQFEKLQDQVPQFPYADVKNIIEIELKAPMDTIFYEFNETPIAAASIGQVHRATLISGEDVAVKIQRPDIRKTIEVDLEIILNLATLLENNIESLRIYSPTGIVTEFAETLMKEIDYKNEAINIERFASQFLNEPHVYIPKLFPEISTTKVFTMEYIDGIKASDIERLDREGYDKKVIAIRGAELIFEQIFTHGFFHADPHPGNIMILHDNVICYLDFGMMGRINRQTKEDFVDLVIAVIQQNEVKSADILLQLIRSDVEIDRRKLEQDISDITIQYLNKPLKDIHGGRVIQQFMTIIARHQLHIPPNLFLMIKAMTTVGGLGMMLDPDFEYNRVATPYIKRVRMERMHPKRMAEDMFNFSTHTIHTLKEFPDEIRDILQQAKAGHTTIRVEPYGLTPIFNVIDRVSNLISFSIVLASLVVGSGLIIHAGTPPRWMGISMIGIIGFLGAGILGFWLLISILRHGRI